MYAMMCVFASVCVCDVCVCVLLFVHQCFYRRINLVQLDDACHYRRYMLWNNRWIHYPHECIFLQGHGPAWDKERNQGPITGEPPPKKKHTTSQRGNSSFHDIFNYLRWSTCEVINTPSHEGSALASCLSAMINWMDSGFRICQESGICSSRYIKFIFIFHRVVPPAYVSWFATTLSIELSCPLGLIKPSLLVNNPASPEFWGFPPNSRATPSISK